MPVLYQGFLESCVGAVSFSRESALRTSDIRGWGVAAAWSLSWGGLHLENWVYFEEEILSDCGLGRWPVQRGLAEYAVTESGARALKTKPWRFLSIF